MPNSDVIGAPRMGAGRPVTSGRGGPASLGFAGPASLALGEAGRPLVADGAGRVGSLEGWEAALGSKQPKAESSDS